MSREIKGIHVFAMFAVGFSIIIGVNLTLATQAIRTFPGLEVKNSYVASQSFDARRAAQLALGWDVSAGYENGKLRLDIHDSVGPVIPTSIDATLGRATNISQDQSPVFVFDGAAHVVSVDLEPGNWNLRLKAVAEDGTMFEQRIPFVAKR
ncbi:FixH family protein [Litoreibacter arenae]|uniref:Type cbb3 cytochrome oxidase biogenesis protein CcoH n=1 Tax=Litoreibacter arenae DSM 19593 TaxID=1123360 RepID=S9QBL5_9RHOB|nr:FixH family protein [Litoreibacter arenae]EPX77003.1 Type cbb3 cytochrome oxidase biogenesis protein CcoH [Litoreibacter arenae DSM 19593]